MLIDRQLNSNLRPKPVRSFYGLLFLLAVAAVSIVIRAVSVWLNH